MDKDETFLIELGDRIRTRRKELHMTQDELARKLGYNNRSTIAKVESGVNELTQSKIAAFAKILKTSPAYLMGWSDNAELPPADPDKLTQDEQELIGLYRQLNEEGQEEVSDYADTLVRSGKFEKKHVQAEMRA